jgi:PIN domain nuclease of toxin-antitoxin system
MRLVGHNALTEVPMSVGMALAAYALPEPFYKDPADRVIVAVARLLKVPVVTIDRRILVYGAQGHVQVVAY